MKKLSTRKELGAVQDYLSGYSYDEIVRRRKISKGAVANIIADLKEGHILEIEGAHEQLESLRELAIDLRKAGLNVPSASMGLALFSHLQSIGVEPADIGPWIATCRELAAGELNTESLVRTAQTLRELRKQTGLTAEGLEEKVQSLRDEKARLEPIVEQLHQQKQEALNLEKVKRSLAVEISQLEKQRLPLSRNVKNLEGREKDLSRRVPQLEQRAQDAEERLATARRDMKTLAGLGLSPDDLPGFVQRVGSIAQKHSTKPADLRERLLRELEQMDKGLTLEALVKTRQNDLKKATQAVDKATRDKVSLDTAIGHLQTEHETLRQIIIDEREFALETIRSVSTIARDSAAQFTQQVNDEVTRALSGVRDLRDQTLEFGQEMGQFMASLEANRWLKGISALFRGESDIAAAEIRVIGLTLLRSLSAWLDQNRYNMSVPYGLDFYLKGVIQELEQWKV
ncbi:hypothetical protein ACFLWX_00270 [Chloroflexota bacterium]